MKTCSVCKIKKPLSDYHKDKSSKLGVVSKCKQCVAEHYKDNREKIQGNEKRYKEKLWETKEGHIQMLRKGCMDRARKEGVAFNLTTEYLNSISVNICPVLGLELGWTERRKNTHKDNCPSLDRIIPTQGYVESNVAWMSLKANIMKNDASFEQLHQFADWVKRTIPQ